MSAKVNTENVRVLHARARVQAIDLDRIGLQLQAQPGWDAERAAQAVEQYRQFLTLVLLNPGQCVTPPGPDADAVWHAHILDTQAYQRDCQRLFGGFLHHRPAHGVTDDEATLTAAAREKTASLLRTYFPETAPSEAPVNREAFCVCLVLGSRDQADDNFTLAAR